MSRFARRQRSYIHLPAKLRKRFSWMCAVRPRSAATAASRTCMFALATYGLATFAAAATPDILFIAVDDLRPALGCYGDPLAQSPHMDALARRGTLFRQAHCQIAVCSPSRWSLLTGKRPNSLGVWDLGTYVRDHDPEIQTLPQFFRQRGYFTQSVGKILHGSGGPSKDPPSWSAPPQYDVVREPTLRYATPENLAGSGLKRAASESADVPDSQYVDGRVCDVAIRLLAERSQRAEPFFLAVGFRKPHLPFCAPQRYWQLHDAKQIPDPDPRTYPDGAPEWATRSWRELEGYTDIPNRGDVPIEKVRQLRHGYYACVSYVDALIGRLLKACQAQTHRQVIVVLWGDHGFHLGEQGLWTKANNYEWATRVPLIIAVPGQTPRHVDTIVELLDVFPTLCELCDFPVPEDLEGRSRAAWWSPSPPSETGWALSQFPRQRKGHRHRGAGDIMGYALRTPGFRYVQWREGLRGEVLAQELYDHRSDPTESHSVADDPAHAAQIAEFKRQLTGLISPYRSNDSMRHPLDCVLLALACLLITGSAHAADSARPHVLFLAVDDMKDWIGCLGGYPGTVHTPHLDALARRGTLFTNAHCASPKCAPSRAALLTGLRPSTTGLYDNSHWWLPNFPDVKTLPAHFRDHGYRAVGAGKIFHHTAGNHPPNQWDAFQPIRFRADPWFRGSRQNYPWSRHTPFPAGFPFSGVKGLGHENDWGALPIEEHDYDDAQTVAYALEQLQQTAQTSDPQPLFLACGIFRPHLPWYVPQTYFDLYPLTSIQLPRVHPNDLDDVPDAGRKFAEARAEDARTIQSAGKWREAVQAYLASISYADAQLGKLLEALYASSLVKNTIIVLWSDHGWHLGEKGHWHKSTLWEEATRVPLIIVVPGAAPGVCRQPVSLLDIFPTLIDLCQLSPLASLDGHSLAPLVKAPQQNWPYPAVTEFRSGNAAVRSDRFRLIRYQDGSEELYDHQTDPEEWHNLASQQSHATVRAELARWLPTQWAAPAATKKAFTFDPDRFEWTHRESGAVIRGRE